MLWSFFFTWFLSSLVVLFVICWGWLKTRGLFAMCDMRRLFASEFILQIACKIVRKNEIKKNVVNISFLKKNWKFGHLLLTSFEDKLKIEPPPPLYTLYEGSKHVNINWRLKIEIEIVHCTHQMKAANCKHCPLIWNWISKVIAAEGEHKASRSVMNVVNVKFIEKKE